MNAKVAVSGEIISNDSLNTLLLDERGRTILRNTWRGGRKHCKTFEKQEKPQKKRRAER